MNHQPITVIQPMTPDEMLKPSINYSYAENRFGKILIASTPKGVCYLAFDDDGATAFKELKALFPDASFRDKKDEMQERALIFLAEKEENSSVYLHVKATAFQLQVWEALLEIGFGELTSYGEIAKRLHNPKACRAVGSAVGSNPVSLIIPCHRVVQSTGGLGGYHWGKERKQRMIEFEKSHEDNI